jgi:hypothetical protein
VFCGVAIAAMGPSGCYPGEIEGVAEADLVLTAYDPTAPFESYSTYAMPDTIIRVDGLGTDLLPAPALDQQVLDAVATEFAALGYTRLDATSPTAPDVVVVLTVSVEELPSWNDDFWWGYWGWFPGWGTWYPAWDSGWTPEYPWAENYAGARGAGTLQVAMIDADHSAAQAQAIPSVWATTIDGLFTGNEASVVSRFQALIRRAFEQSPYL